MASLIDLNIARTKIGDLGEFNKMFHSIVNLGEWEGVSGQPATSRKPITIITRSK